MDPAEIKDDAIAHANANANANATATTLSPIKKRHTEPSRDIITWSKEVIDAKKKIPPTSQRWTVSKPEFAKCLKKQSSFALEALDSKEGVIDGKPAVQVLKEEQQLVSERLARKIELKRLVS